MKLKFNLKNTFVEITCILYILLFVYAATSKLLDFENFQVQLGQSPLLSAFAGVISWGVIIIEFGIAVLLIFTWSRLIGLYSGFCLMCMFTAYIFIMLNFSSFVPCSCGGILEKMSWETHLIFNIFFAFMAALAIIVNPIQTALLRRISKPTLLFLIFASGSVFVTILFLSSEKIMHYKNPFIRHYPHHPVSIENTIDLKYNSYYFAGHGEDKLYLGNSTTPFALLSIDKKLEQKYIRIRLKNEKFNFKSVRIAIRSPFFYIMDGNVPSLFKGKTGDWTATQIYPAPPYFNIGYPIDSNSIIFRGNSSKTHNSILGTYSWGKKDKVTILNHLLQKQIDGVFDTDGMLFYSQEMNRIIYLYAYRNDFLVADKNGILQYTGHTIDTNRHAKIKVAYLKGGTVRTMSAPALVVNKASSVDGKYLYVNSNVPGRFEVKQRWDEQSVIDVYDLKKKSYLFSFTIDNLNGKKLRNFYVVSGKIFVLIDKNMIVYKFSNEMSSKMK